ncbi:MAG: hypothetical protein PHU08_04285, partial [Dehalococcoidales bacterium]|nr:hypothetical protein [Dehalococcoidales bacterium]
AVIALIAAAAYSIVIGQGISDIPGIVIAVIALLALRTRKLDPILLLVLAGVAGMVVYGLQ